MRSFMFAAASVAAFTMSSAVSAQTVVVTPEQETVIREYVKKEPAISLSLPGFEFNIGSTVPDTVELHEVPDVEYRYVVIDDRTVLVEPGTRRIVKVYD